MRFTLFCLLPIIFAFDASATQLKPLSVEDLTKRSDRVVHGTVLSKTVRRDTVGRIYTTVDLEVIEHLRGNETTNRFAIVYAGGVLGEKGVIASGQEDYRIGEEVVVFASLNRRGQAITVGMAQGKFNVTRDKQSARVSNSVRDKDGPLTLEQLKQRVKGVAR